MQAFGFFEAEVQIPTGNGMWSAFWLQCNGTGTVGDEGRDGSEEIDIYEACFPSNPQHIQHAIHYDAGPGYTSPSYKNDTRRLQTDVNLHEGYHKYGLLWNEAAYVFFVDGKPTWATKFGDISRVKEFMRLRSKSAPRRKVRILSGSANFLTLTEIRTSLR